MGRRTSRALTAQGEARNQRSDTPGDGHDRRRDRAGCRWRRNGDEHRHADWAADRSRRCASTAKACKNGSATKAVTAISRSSISRPLALAVTSRTRSRTTQLEKEARGARRGLPAPHKHISSIEHDAIAESAVVRPLREKWFSPRAASDHCSRSSGRELLPGQGRPPLTIDAGNQRL